MIPGPLHPAIVYFPIAFLLLAAVLSLVSFCITRKSLMIATAIIFVLGSSTTYLAMKKGNKAKDHFLEVYPEQKEALEKHSETSE